MKSVYGLVAVSLVVAACGGGAPAEPEAPAQMPYGNLAQMMRAIPFPASNVVYDASTTDPGAPPDPAGSGGGARYSNVYGGWEAVVNAGVAMQETANLLRIPGRVCENGRPAPQEDETFQQGIQALADAGAATIAAGEAAVFDEDALFELTDVVTNACSTCHEVYRDRTADNADRCIPEAELPADAPAEPGE
jgi:cytochrome c556